MYRTCGECRNYDYVKLDGDGFDKECKITNRVIDCGFLCDICEFFELGDEYDEPRRKDMYCSDCVNFYNPCMSVPRPRRVFDCDGYSYPCINFKENEI